MTKARIPITTGKVNLVTGTQTIKSARWPFGRNKFYELVKANLIKPHFTHEGARPVYSVEEINAAFQPCNA
ncbi:hypothetical protein AB1A64_00970 [Ruegeria sp. ANG10]|uniref:hypothetical protein n=1 Tax=Ruegeria sp. ANG10 TaxID=3042467 RepID=UPI003451298B